VNVSEKVAALTYDDGPDPRSTPQFLELLDRHAASATFFMIGERAAASRALVAEVARRGHAIGNHSWDHSTFTDIGSTERRSQLIRTQQELKPHGVRLFRPPRGHLNPSVRRDLAVMRYTPVMWNVDLDDWRCSDAEAMRARLLADMRPGCIVLLHDSIWRNGSEFRDRNPLLEALDAALADLTDYRFVTLPELLQSGRPVWSHWSYEG
jgi:peptidoglycan/xylan/chitin deacetylase (PgdA/CDA1 family)